MQYVTLINRTSKVLEGVWDGKRYKIQPGKNEFPEVQAVKFKEQSPLMGSQDPYSLDITYLCGIEENGDDCTPLEQSPSIELLNRSKLVGAKPVDIVSGKGGLYSRNSPEFAGVPPDGGFVKP